MLKNENEINAEIGKILNINDAKNQGKIKGLFGLSYEDGIRDALEWTLGETDDPLLDLLLDPEDYPGVDLN